MEAINNDRVSAPQIVILLATYNGEKFLQEQIESLYGQTVKDWKLYIHDDGSIDKTCDILNQYVCSYDNIFLLDYPSQHSAKDNFLSMVKMVDADYYFFCDQDDKWFAQKIEKEMDRMRQQESAHPNLPVIVFSDLSVTDCQLCVTSESMWKSAGIRPELLSSFDKGGVFEYVTGCTMLFNRQAKDSLIYPAAMISMHDTWLTLCVLKAGGIVSAICEPLVFYRQHGKNTLGASSWKSNSRMSKIRNIRTILINDFHHWQMLKTLKYGSFTKYMYYKYVYRRFCATR